MEELDETKCDTFGTGKMIPKKFKQGPLLQHVHWTIKEKKKLLSLLQEYPLDAYDRIASRITGKDAEQVKEYILSVKRKIKNKQKRVTKEAIQRAPLEEWLDIASDMVEYENVDSSSNLAKVMTVISNFEDFQTVKLETSCGPDYKSIYKFMAQLLQPNREEDLVKLGPLESAIMLDMLHSLMDVLSDHDLTVQRNIMKWKYQLMESRDKSGHGVQEYLRKASENDFSDFINEAKVQREETFRKNAEHDKRYMARVAKGEKKGKGKASAASSSVPDNRSMPTFLPLVPSNEPEVSGVQTQVEEEEEVGSTEEVKDKPSTSIRRHKPGRKGALDPPEIPRTEIYLVMPPKGVEIVNYNPRAKKVIKERKDGKYQALNQEEELINNDLSREITYDVHRSQLNQFSENPQQRIVPTEQERRWQEKEEKEISKYAPVMKSDTEHSKHPVKKPKLYSLNPFCLPVTLLDLNMSKKPHP